MDAELARIDDDVGVAPNRLEGGPLQRDRLGERGSRRGVGSSGLLVTAHEDRVLRVEEEHGGAHAASMELEEHGLEVLVGEPSSSVDDDGHLRPGSLGDPGTVDDLPDEGGGEVVDDEEAEVLEDVRRLRPSCPRQPHST